MVVRAALLSVLLLACEGPARRTQDGWTTEGLAPPPGADRVLALAAQLEPWCDLAGQWGGTVEWVDSLWPLADMDGIESWLGGEVPRLVVVWMPDVTETALAHEALHAAQEICTGAPWHDAEFFALAAQVNAESAW